MTAAQPILALVERDVGRAIQERGFRGLVIALLGVNTAIAATFVFQEMEYAGAEFTNLAPVVARMLGGVTYAGALLVVVTRAATGITTERARDTWTMVRMTPSRPMLMVLAQVLAAMIPALLLAASQLPLVMLLFLFVDGWFKLHFALAAGVAVWSLFVAAAWCVLASAYFKRFPPLFFCTLLILSLASGMLNWILYGIVELIAYEYMGLGIRDWTFGIIVQQQLLQLVPYVQMYQITDANFFWSDLGAHAGVTGLSALFAIFSAAWILKRERDPTEALPSASRAGWRLSRTSTQKAPMSMKPIPDWMNPIYALETHHRRYRSQAVVRRLLLLIVGLYLVGITATGGSSANTEAMTFIMVVVVAMSLWVTATGVAADHERDTFGLVALTGLSQWAILRGRFLAGLVSLAPFLVFALIFFLAPIALGPMVSLEIDVRFIAAATITLSVSVLMHMASGLFASMMTKTTRESVVMNALIAVVVHYGFAILVVGICFGVFALIEANTFGLQRWFDPARYPARLSPEFADSLASMVSPVLGLVYLLQENGSARAWGTWLISVLFAAGWMVFFYRTAAALLANDLEGRERRFRPKLQGP